MGRCRPRLARWILAALLPEATPEVRLVAVLMSLTIEPPSPTVPTDQSVDAVPPPARGGVKSGAARPARPARPTRQLAARKGRPASQPILDAAGRLQASGVIGGVGCVSQATARKALGVSCVQMLRLENQKLLTRIQEPLSRLVHYSTAEVQRLLDLIDREPEPEPSHDGDVMV